MEPVSENAPNSSRDEQHQHTHFAFPESSVTGGRPLFRPTARSLRQADSNANHDAALLTLLQHNDTAASPVDSAESAEAESEDAFDDDPLGSVDEVFTELALL
jgi:hypothetical protein